MKGIKDFFHNMNDILLAVVIVAVAAGVIFWRMNIIMAYPEKVASENAVQTEQAADDANGAEASEASETSDNAASEAKAE